MYIYRIQAVHRSYGRAILGGLDTLIFTYDVGLRYPGVREAIYTGMERCAMLPIVPLYAAVIITEKATSCRRNEANALAKGRAYTL